MPTFEQYAVSNRGVFSYEIIDGVPRPYKDYKGILYRGLYAPEYADFFKVKVNKIWRNSAYLGVNLYASIINEHPMWQDFPKRQVICTTSEDKAQIYGNSVYHIIPIDLEAKMGICPTSDIYSSFEKWPLHVGSILKGTVKSLKDLEKALEAALKSKSIAHYLKEKLGIERKISAKDFIKKYYSPENFEIKKFTEVDSEKMPDREVWFDSDFYAIRY